MEMIPEFKFAVSERVGSVCPTSVTDPKTGEQKEIVASDFMPGRAREKDTGYDVRCAEPDGIAISPHCYFKIPLGIRMFAPEGWWVELRPRSGTFLKEHIHALYGVIDELYENELVFAGCFVPDRCKLIAANSNLVIPFGFRIGQLVPVKRQAMICTEVSNEELDRLYAERNGARGTGGFGSSGKF